MRYNGIDLTQLQHATAKTIQAELMTRKGRSQSKTLQRLSLLGYSPVWRRVVWTGGVGSYRVMPNSGTIRILVCACESGYHHPKAIWRGGIPYKGGPRKQYFKYGWCVEIQR